VSGLHQVSYAMKGHKESGQSVGADALVRLTGFAPPTIHSAAARLGAGLSRRLFNVVVRMCQDRSFRSTPQGPR